MVFVTVAFSLGTGFFQSHEAFSGLHGTGTVTAIVGAAYSGGYVTIRSGNARFRD